ncbi:hypothetical protein [Micromonospora sp. NPDC005305]|uniref:hypothetical protein n=1 Tax=Micromonospora sp. NPDC005305 TaxID=3156875 RepID=UPI0033A5387D
MTRTPGDDDGSRAGETNSTEPAAGTGATPASRQVSDHPEATRDRWEGWLARARELWTVARRVAKRLWTAARPVLEQLRWQEAESAAVTLVDRRAAPTLLVPAQGQVYHFVVQTTFTWTSNHARPELFGWYVDQFQPQAMQRLRRIAVRCAAEIPPDHPRAFALALDDAMTGDDTLPWAYERGGVRFTCEPDVSIHLDEPVRELLRPYWDKRIALEWKRDLERRRAEYAEEERIRRQAKAQDDGAGPTADMPEAQDDSAGPTADMPEAQDDGAGPEAGMPEALREEHPPRQREAEADGAGGTGRRPAEQGQREAGAGDARRGPRSPDSPVEQWTPLEPFPQPPAPHPAPGQRPAPVQPGETTPASGDPDSPGPPDA